MPEQQVLVLDPSGSAPDAEHRALRSRGSATLVDILGVRAWSVSDPALLKLLLTSKDVSKDGRAHWSAFVETVPTWPLALWVAVNNMFTAHGKDHSRLRRLVAPALSARRTAALQTDIEAIVNGILDDLEALPAGEVADLREHLAYPLPITVISKLMGAPHDRRTEFRTVVDNVFATHLSAEEQAANTTVLYGLLDSLIETRRAEPGEDMTSLLLDARDEEGDGSALSDAELRDTLLLMISAGYETTANVIDQAVTTLLSEPQQLAHAREGRITWQDVVEETLRHQPAVKHLPLRYARSDISLPDGQTIRSGEAILASYAAANRHPSWHQNADRFDATRPSKDHLAFGHGVHFCLGAPLARLEVAIALRLLFERFPDARLATESAALEKLPSLISNGHISVPVHLRPVASRRPMPTMRTNLTAPAPTTPLTPAERRIAQHLVNGLLARHIADAEALSHNTVRAHVLSLRRKLHCPHRCTLAVVTHRLLSAQEASVPQPDAPAPELNTEQLRLLQAVTEHSKPLDIARAAGLAPRDLRATLDQLLIDTGTPDTTVLVARAHGWSLLAAGQTSTPQTGARR